MSFQEAFKAVETGGETKLNVNINVFKREGELGGRAKFVLDEIQKRLDFMQTFMGKKLNKDEKKIASLAIEEELEKSIPNRFKEYYDAEKTWDGAADLIAGNILSNVNHYIGEVLTNSLSGTGKLDDASRFGQVVDIVDSESWTGSVNKKEAGKIYAALAESQGKETTKEAVLAFQENYKPSKANNFADGVVALRGGKNDINDAMNAK